MMDTLMPWGQIGSAAVCVGIARAAAETTKAHLLNSRLEHVDQALASLPILRTRLAQMQIQVDTQAAFLDHAARLIDNPGPGTLLAVLLGNCSAIRIDAAVRRSGSRSAEDCV